METTRNLSEDAIRVLRVIEDGHSVTAIRNDVYDEIHDLIGPDVPCLLNAVLTEAGRATLAALRSERASP